MRNLLAASACVVLVLAGHLVALPLAAGRALRGGVGYDSRAARAALYWDLMLGELLGADRGETVSTWAARLRPGKTACAFCALLHSRWPSHCDDSAGVRFDLVKR